MLRILLDDREGLLFPTAAAKGDVHQRIVLGLLCCVAEAGREASQLDTSFRCLVAQTLARQFTGQVKQCSAPSQFASSTRAGTDCVGHAIGAHDIVSRSSMMSKLLDVLGLQKLPFVRKACSQISRCAWEDHEGVLSIQRKAFAGCSSEVSSSFFGASS